MEPTQTVELAIPSYWWKEAMFLELFFRGALRRSLSGMDITVTSTQNNNYNGVGVIRCDDKIAMACDVVVPRINEGMRLTDADDPFAKLRELAIEDKKQEEELDKLMDDYFEAQEG